MLPADLADVLEPSRREGQQFPDSLLRKSHFGSMLEAHGAGD